MATGEATTGAGSVWGPTTGRLWQEVADGAVQAKGRAQEKSLIACGRCGERFEAAKKKRYCSARCAGLHTWEGIACERPPKPCGVCGALLPVLRAASLKYCSSACSEAANDRLRREAFRARGFAVDCERCAKPIEVTRLKRQGGRTKFCAACGPIAQRERVVRNRKELRQVPQPCRQCARAVPESRLAWNGNGELMASARFCSPACERTFRLALNGEGLNIASGKIGAVHELWVSADLLARGYEVFRSVSQCASCDLVALRDGQAIRVEVRSAKRSLATGKLDKPITAKDRGRYDVAAFVERNGRITYSGLPDGERAQ